MKELNKKFRVKNYLQNLDGIYKIADNYKAEI